MTGCRQGFVFQILTCSMQLYCETPELICPLTWIPCLKRRELYMTPAYSDPSCWAKQLHATCVLLCVISGVLLNMRNIYKMGKSRGKRRKKRKGRKGLAQEKATMTAEHSAPSALAASTEDAQPLDQPAAEAPDKRIDLSSTSQGSRDVAAPETPVVPPAASRPDVVASPSLPRAKPSFEKLPVELFPGEASPFSVLLTPARTAQSPEKALSQRPSILKSDGTRRSSMALSQTGASSMRSLKSTGAVTGTIVSSNDMASSLLVLPVCFLASNRNKPNFVGGGIALVGVGNLVITMAHFLAPPYKPGGVAGADETCPKLHHAADTGLQGDSVRHFRFVLIFGQILAGIGTTPVHTVSVAYLVENMHPEKAPAYVGMFNSMAVFGPSLGFIIGGLTLKCYVDILTDYKALGITSSSGSWVGAWWLGFLVSAVLGLVLGFIMVMFPKHLPGHDELSLEQEKNVIESIHTLSVLPTCDFGDRLSDLPRALFKLCKNATLDLICLARSFSLMYVTGITTVLTKFLETQFALTSSKAALLIGPLVLVAGVGGAIAGGVLVSKLKLGCTGILRLCIANSFLSVLSILVFWWACPDTDLAVNTNKTDTQTSSSQYDLPCNSHCGCTEDVVQLICSAENQLYLSPCYAGCQVAVAGGNITGYTQCYCVNAKMSMHGSDGTVEVQAVRARCISNCGLLVPYLAAIVTSLTSVFLSLAPSTAVAIQVVKPKERALALGLLGLITRVLGSIPAPMMFGMIVDSTCAAWNKPGGHRGNCVSYRNIDLAHGVFFTLLMCIFACIACYGGALYKVSKMEAETEKGNIIPDKK
ncbi:solute carrier organic anion transporter family member 4A1-like isoform X2 [Ornithodoros turicata]|uniref:solute carrier organic anion transporter family member 4A1-like isoform X2 n=1 Tax=Ornithodoros turicata TaxID=34597 RepID=UPI003138B46B